MYGMDASLDYGLHNLLVRLIWFAMLRPAHACKHFDLWVYGYARSSACRLPLWLAHTHTLTGKHETRKADLPDGTCSTRSAAYRRAQTQGRWAHVSNHTLTQSRGVARSLGNSTLKDAHI